MAGEIGRQLISSRTASCGCLEETWVIANLDVVIHFESDHGKQFADCFVDAGDWSVENRHAGTPDEAREAAFRFIESWSHEDEIATPASLSAEGER